MISALLQINFLQSFDVHQEQPAMIDTDLRSVLRYFPLPGIGYQRIP
jgi:hypothetical protein